MATRDPRRRRERLRDRLAIVAGVRAAVLCAIVVWPGVVEQGDLDAKPVNALAAVGILIALGLTQSALCARRRRRRRGPSAAAGTLLGPCWPSILVLARLPWFAGRARLLPGRRARSRAPLFMSGEPRPEPGHPDLTAVHLGHHHGLDGTLLALVGARALAGRSYASVRAFLRGAFGFYVALMLVYGLANALQDFWLEQLVKRGTTSLEIPTHDRAEGLVGLGRHARERLSSSTSRRERR